MKILLTTDTYFPMINGVTISTYNLYNELKKMGNEVKIMALSDTGEEKVCGDVYYLKSIKVRVYPESKIKKPLSGELVGKLVEWKPDIIHSQTEFSTMLTAKYIARRTGAVKIHTYHTMYENYLKYFLHGMIITPKVAFEMIKLILNSMDGVIVPTKKVMDVLLKHGVKTNMYIVPTGIDLSKFKTDVRDFEKIKLKNKYGIDKNDKIMLYVGRVAQEKNIDEVIFLFKRVIRYIKNLKFLIVGGGPYIENLKCLVKKLGLNQSVLFTGMIEPEEIYKYYQIGDIFVTASTSETQGLTYVEALASGLPVVCRYDPCIDGLIVNGEDGFAYDKPPEFFNAVETIFSNHNIRHHMQYSAKLKSEEYSSGVFGKNVQNVYNYIINSLK